MSPDVLFTVVIWATLTYMTASVRFAFDCNRNGQECGNGVCQSNGVCDCTPIADPKSEGFDCGIVTAQKLAVGDCPNTCKNNGVCVKVDETTNTCACNDKFYGNDCSLDRVDVKCIGRSMYINMNTAGTFAGIAFVKGYRDTAQCLFVDVADVKSKPNVPTAWKGQALILDLDNKTICGDLAVPDTNNKEYEAKFYINYNKQFVTSTDEVISAKCVFSDTNTAEGKVTGVTVTDDLYKGGSVTGNYDPVLFALTQGTGATIPPDGLSIGTPLSFTFNIPEKSGFKTLLVKSMKATDSNPSSSAQLQIIENGCHTKLGKTVIAEQFKMDEALRTFSGKITLFKFIQTSDILFISEVLVCDDTTIATCASDCTKKTTPTASTGNRRKKRGAGSLKELTITKSVTIANGQSSTANHDTQTSIKEDCLQRTEVLVTIVTVSAFLVALLVVCLVLVCRMMTFQKRAKMTSYHNDAANSTLTIPRACVSNF